MTVVPTRFGFTLPQRGVLFGATTVAELMMLAARADDNPLFDSLWVGDSLFAKPRPDSLTLLGALTTRTRRLVLGVGCMASFPVRDPLVFAYQWATLDLLSGGRMLLAACTGLVGGGKSAREGGLWGIADGARAERLTENIEICRRLWSGTDVSFTGRFRSFEGVTVEPRPIQQPCPIWIASNPRPPTSPAIIDRALARVAKIADGWMTTRLSPDILRSNWTRLATHLAAAGREPSAFPTLAYHNVNVNPDRQAALDESKRFLDEYYGPVFTPAMVEAWTAAGTPEQCVAHLRGLGRDGAKAITLRITSWNQREQFERLVEDVLPRASA